MAKLGTGGPLGPRNGTAPVPTIVGRSPLDCGAGSMAPPSTASSTRATTSWAVVAIWIMCTADGVSRQDQTASSPLHPVRVQGGYMGGPHRQFGLVVHYELAHVVAQIPPSLVARAPGGRRVNRSAPRSLLPPGLRPYWG